MSKPKKDDIILSRATPDKSADRFRSSTGYETLLRVEQEWLIYKDGAYVLKKDESMRAAVRRFLRTAKTIVMVEDENGGKSEATAPFNPKRADVAELLQALEDGCYSEASAPSWLDDEEHPDPKNIISLANGLLDVTTCVKFDPSPSFFTRTALPIMFEEKPGEPTQFLKFLREITSAENDDKLTGREPLIQLIREMMGYLIWTDTEQEVVFYLLGKSRGGKGTLMKIIKALIGKRNLAAPTIRSFSNDFWAHHLMDKSVAMVTDMAISDREKIKLAANHINMLSGRDPVDVNRKFKDIIPAITLPTRVLMAGNAMPDFGDHAEALANRLLVIPFKRTFKHCMDTGLARRIIATELPAILLWALKGLQDLRARKPGAAPSMIGNFIEPQESIRAKRVLMTLANPVLVFVEDKCVIDQGSAIKMKVYEIYRMWCQVNGVKNVLTLQNFSLRLYEAVPGCKDFRPRVNGEQVPCYSNVKLKGGDSSGSVTNGADFDAFKQIESGMMIGLTADEAIAEARTAYLKHESGEW